MNTRGATLSFMIAGALCGASPDLAQAQTTTERVASGLSSPIFATAPSNDPTRLYIAEQGNNGSAHIKILNLETNTLSPNPFITITGIDTDGFEQGLLGLAFDPDFATNRKFYVNVTAPGGEFDNGITEIRQYTALSEIQGDNSTFKTLLSIDQPQENHNGGWIGFSPRAGERHSLYIATGDGGGSDDNDTGHVAGGNAQSTSSLLGKILRIEVDPVAGTYTNPASNPFDNEIFTIGLRNPFRSSFDRLTGDLFIGDVGQQAREEVNRQLASNPGGGENFGWRLREGTIQTPSGGVGGPRPEGNVDPILEYDRTVGTTITGGYVYRGSASPLYGKYIFGDFGNGKLFMANPDGTAMQDITTLLDPIGAQRINTPSSFAEDASGEVYVVDYDGEIYKVVPEPGTAAMLCIGALFLARRRR
ncbi:MAG: PQQ-dependent sugar dehydrogenase [Chthoniobacteraceae bacterium]